MERGSSKHGPALDEEMKRETESFEKGAPAGGRIEEGRDPEGWADGEPMTDARLNRGSAERRSDLARYLGRDIFPAQRDALLKNAMDNNAPAEVESEIARLPNDVSFASVQEIWNQLNGDG
jgi:hypothetical protein